MKHLLYLGPSGRELWSKGKDGWCIENTLPTSPVWVITDFAEESFAEIEMPRLYGRDRITFIARQLANRFPDTPYRAVLSPPQGGGLMEKLAPTHQIFLAVNNPERLNTELGDTPVTGIWPISLLISLFCHQQKLPADLLVVLPEQDALRIVYLKNHSPVITRLTPTPNEVVAQIEEIIRTKRYLENTRMIDRGQACPVLLLGPAERFAIPLAAAQFQLLPPPSPWDIEPPQDWRLPLFDLALRSPAGQVAPIALRAKHLAHRLRQAALSAAALCLIVALWGASGNLHNIFNTLNQREQARIETQQLADNITKIEVKTAGFGVDPELLKNAITLDEEQITSIPSFASHLGLLSHTLESIPEFRLKQLEWRLLDADTPACKKTDSPVAADPPPAEEELSKERRIELSFELVLPENYGPRDQTRLLRKTSQQLREIAGIKLLNDPASDIDRGVLQSSTAQSVQKTASWCFSLPGNTRPIQMQAESQ